MTRVLTRDCAKHAFFPALTVSDNVLLRLLIIQYPVMRHIGITHYRVLVVYDAF